MVNSLSVSIVTLLFNRTLMRLAGSDGVSSITIILYAMSLLSSVYMGYVMGISPLISFNYGKQDDARLKRIFRISLIAIAAASLATFALSLACARPLVSIFSRKGTPVYELAVRGFRLFAAAFLFMGVNIFSSALFTALSNGVISAVLSVFRSLIFVAAAILLFPLVMGVDGVWIAIPAGELLGFAMSLFFFVKKKKTYRYA